MPPVGFEPTISAGERPKTYTLDCVANYQQFILVINRCTYICILLIKARKLVRC